MELTFLRHAKTALNGKGYVATKLDYSLTKEGIEECKKNQFSTDIFADVYCSPYKRTYETSKIIYPFKEPIKTDLITQRDLGILNEKLKMEFSKEYLSLIKNYQINPIGAESLEDILKRITNFFGLLLNNYDEKSKILIVTHNGIMRIIKKYFLGYEYDYETNNLGKFVMKLERCKNEFRK